MNNAIHLIDSHCHPPPDATEGASVAGWMERSTNAGVLEWIAIGTESDDWRRHADLARKYPGTVHWTAGLHPSHVTDNLDAELETLESLLADPAHSPPPCAVGEIGLDYTRLPKEGRNSLIDRQKSAFAAQLDLARKHGLPVVLHSRGTVPDCLEILGSSGFPAEHAIFHCFAEGPGTLAEVREAGALCSFTGIPTFRNAGDVRAALKENGLESLILETDSPYLSPEPFRGKPNEPSRVRVIAEFCAEFFETSLEEIARITHRNTRDFFRLPSSPKESPI